MATLTGVMMIDSQGNIYDGDQLLFAIVRSRLRQGAVAGVVGTLMTNLAFEHALADCKVPFVRAAVGDRYVMDMLRQKGWLYGGENSGHILCLDRHTTGDGIVSALQVLSALREAGGDLQQLLGDLTLYPQKLINVALSKGFPWQGHPLIGSAQREVESELNGSGRVLLRASGTEPLLRVMVEGQDSGTVAKAAEKLAAAVREASHPELMDPQSDEQGQAPIASPPVLNRRSRYRSPRTPGRDGSYTSRTTR
jgi:phosphoglucosamine mutase